MTQNFQPVAVMPNQMQYVQENVVVEQPNAIDNNAENSRIRTLSSGVKVKFGMLPASIKQKVTVTIFENTKLKNGQIVVNNDSNDQLKLAAKVMEYHDALISWGVELVGDIDTYVANGVVDKRWEKRLQQSGIASIADDLDREFAFLRYIAFASEDDWALLGEMLMTE
jgi:hypothetical protein